MKGSFEHFMAKEIQEQPESLTNTMRGRVVPPSEALPHGRIQARLADVPSPLCASHKRSLPTRLVSHPSICAKCACSSEGSSPTPPQFVSPGALC